MQKIRKILRAVSEIFKDGRTTDGLPTDYGLRTDMGDYIGPLSGKPGVQNIKCTQNICTKLFWSLESLAKAFKSYINGTFDPAIKMDFFLLYFMLSCRKNNEAKEANGQGWLLWIPSGNLGVENIVLWAKITSIFLLNLSKNILKRQVYNGPWQVNFIAAILTVYQYFWGIKNIVVENLFLIMLATNTIFID